jgi:hypothetical protein
VVFFAKFIATALFSLVMLAVGALGFIYGVAYVSFRIGLNVVAVYWEKWNFIDDDDVRAIRARIRP